MPADIVIRGGTVFDGTGAPGRVADVAIADGVIREIGPNLQGDARARRVGLRGHARLHRHPHALRRAGVLGSGAAAVVVPRRHHGRRRQLRLHDRADAPRAPRRRSSARSRTSRTWIPRRWPRASRGTSRRSPSTWRRCAGAAPTLNFTAYIGHSALRLYVMGDAAYERAATADEIERMCRARRRGDRVRRGGVLDELLVRAPRRRRQAGAEPLRRARRGRRAVPSPRGETGKGVVLITPGKQCTYADVYEWQPRVGRPFTYPLFAAPGGKHLEPVAAARAGPGRTARRCGRRSRRDRSRCSSRWRTRTASTPARCSGS